MDSFKASSLRKHKDELKNLTDTVWSIIKVKYEQSKPENLHKVLKERGEMFKKNLMHFYNTNKDKMTTSQMKDAIKNRALELRKKEELEKKKDLGNISDILDDEVKKRWWQSRFFYLFIHISILFMDFI